MTMSSTRGRGISSTIGVVLLLGIVVLLAATTWLFAAGLADGLGPTPPQASFNFEYETGVDDPSCSPPDSCEAEVVRIGHVSGDAFDPERVKVVVHYMDSGTEKRTASDWEDIESKTESITAGKTVGVWTSGPIDTLATARIELLWTSENGERSDVIARWSGPAA